MSDARDSPRVLTLRVHENPFRLEPTGMIHLWGCPEKLDPEGIAILPNGNLLISSEGVQNEEPRTAPGIFEFSRDGEWMRTLNLRDKFIPPQKGPVTVGVRENRGFESLTLAPDGSRFFTAVESALAQDGEPATFDTGTRHASSSTRGRARRSNQHGNGCTKRILRRVRTSQPARSSTAWRNCSRWTMEALLVLERSYAGEADAGPRSLNRIRIYQVSTRGATDVSSMDSLKGQDVRPVSKRLVIDLGLLPNLPPVLAALDNFEGMTFDAPGADGRRRLWLVSDDNFSKQRQVARG